jgi:hypothetical protein
MDQHFVCLAARMLGKSQINLHCTFANLLASKMQEELRLQGMHGLCYLYTALLQSGLSEANHGDNRISIFQCSPKMALTPYFISLSLLLTSVGASSVATQQ